MPSNSVTLPTLKKQLDRMEKIMKQEQSGIGGSASHRIGQAVQNVLDDLIVMKNELDEMNKLQKRIYKKVSKKK